MQNAKFKVSIKGSKLTTLLSIILLLSFGWTWTWAKDDFLFTRRNLKVDGKIVSHIFEDLDGDRLVDLLIFYLPEHNEISKRMVGLFRQKTGMSLDTIPNQIFEPDEKASVVDLADLDKDGKKELLFLAEDGVYAYFQKDGLFDKKPSLLFSTPCFLSSSEEEVLIWDFCPFLEGKDPLLIIPQKKGYDLWAKEKQEGFVHKGTLRINPNISLSSHAEQLDQKRGLLKVSYQMPSLIFADYDQNGENDILMLNEDKMYVFLSTDDGLFPEQADKVLTLKSKGKKESQYVKIDDVNEDRALDLVINETGGDLEKGGKSKTSIYLGKGTEGFNLGSPHQVISSEKEASFVLLCDLNHDGKKEMIMPSWGFGIGSMVKVLLTKSFKFSLYIRSLGANDMYPNQPNRKMGLSVKVSFGESDDSEMQGDEFSGDFNGDGLNDFFFLAGDRILRFFLGRKGDFFADKPQYEMGIEIPAGNHKIMDLNNDGKSDIILIPQKKELEGKITVLYSSM